MASPVVSPYVPGGHWEHDVVAPPVEYEPSGQGLVHADEVRPGVEPYTPAGHGVQAASVAPPMEYEPAAHSPEQDAVAMLDEGGVLLLVEPAHEATLEQAVFARDVPTIAGLVAARRALGQAPTHAASAARHAHPRLACRSKLRVWRALTHPSLGQCL